MASGKVGTNLIEERSKRCSEIQSDVDEAIEIFIKEYETQNDAQILDHQLDKKNMVDEGRHFAAGVVRLRFGGVKKDGTKFRSSVVVKIPHYSKSYEKIKDFKLYALEKCIYKHFFPRAYQYWPHEKISPNFYASLDNGILIFENLEESAFSTVLKDSLFNLADCKVVLKTLAHFHALSFKFLETESSTELRSLMKTVFSDSDSSNMFMSLFGKMRQFVVPTFSQDQVDKWSHFEKNLHDIIMLAYSEPDTDQFKVLCHGDAQYNNLLVRKDSSGNIVECKLIDFQMSRINSPAVDLLYFLSSSAHTDVFKKHRSELLDQYVHVLNTTLEELDCIRRYSLSELKADFLKYQYMPLFLCTVIVPILRVSPKEVPVWDDDDDAKFNVLFQSKEYVSLVHHWIDVIELSDA